MNGNAKLLVAVGVFAITGVAIILTDVIRHGQLHTVSGLVGAAFVLIAACLALPVQMKDAVATLVPFVDKLRGGSDG